MFLTLFGVIFSPTFLQGRAILCCYFVVIRFFMINIVIFIFKKNIAITINIVIFVKGFFPKVSSSLDALSQEV